MQCLTHSKALIVTDDNDADDKDDAGRSSFDSLGYCAPSLLTSDSVSDRLSWKRKVMFWTEFSHCKYPES